MRIGLGLGGVVAGTAWAAGGIDAVRVGALALVGALPALVVLAGVVLLLRLALPRRGLAGPLVLIAVGALALAVQFGMITRGVLDRAGPALLVAGGVAVAMSKRADDPLTAIVRRCWSVFVPGERKITGVAAHKFIVRSVFGDLRLDLTGAKFPEALRVTIDITVLAGVVEVRVPADWELHPGRLDLARRTLFYGDFGTREPAPEVARGEYGKNRVVLNVQGWRGVVRISGGRKATPLQSDSDAEASG